METQVINTLWRPFYGKLVTGLRLLTPEYSTLADLEDFEQLSARQMTWAVDLIFGGGIAYTVDGGSPARAVSNAPVEATDTWRHMARRFEVSYDVLTLENAAQVRDQQVKKQMRYQVKDALRSFKKSVAINFYGHNTGVVALVDTATGTPVTSVTLKDRYGETGLAPDLSWFTENKDKVAVIDPAGPTVRGIELVTSVDRTAGSLTFQNGITGVAAGDLIVFANHLDGTSTDHNRWFNGLLDVARGSSLHGIATADQPDWAPAVDVDMASAALSGSKLALWFTEAENESDYAPNFAWTTPGVIAAAGGTQLDQKRYGADEDTMRLGFKHLNVMGVQTEGRPFCPPGHFFAGNNKALRRLSPDGSDPKKVKTGGPNEFVYYGNQLGYFCDFVFRPQITCKSRKALIVADNVLEETI